MVERVSLDGGRLRIELMRIELEKRLLGASTNGPEPIVIGTAIEIARRGVENRLVVESNAGRSGGAADENLIRAVACGRAWFDELASGQAKSFREIADRVGVTDRYVSRLVDLAFLAPDVVKQILDGQQEPDVTVTALTVEGSVPPWWPDQRRPQ